MLFDEASSGSSNRKSAKSPAPRARCLKPALPDPRWTYRFRQPRLREAAYPPLRGQIDASRYDPASIDRHWSPVARGSACRDRAASAAAWGGTSRHPRRGHRRRPQPRDVRETSLGGTG